MTEVLDRAVDGGVPANASLVPSSDASNGRRTLPVAPLLGVLLLGTAILHLVVAPSRFGESTLLGAGALVAAFLQIGLAAAVFLYPTRLVLRTTALTSLALIALWAISRTASPPVGPDAGHAGAVTFVDGVTIALQAITAVLAAILILTRSKGVATRVPAVIAAFGALAVTIAAIGSPAATGSPVAVNSNRVNGINAQDMTAPSPSDQPLDPATRALLQQQLLQARAFALRYPTASDAEAAGYHLGGGFAPRKGATYISASGLTGPGAFDPSRVETLIYNGTSPRSRVIGLLYFAVAAQAPEGFAGPNDHWQQHNTICVKTTPTLGVVFPADADVTAAQCSSVQGNLYNSTTWTLHAWVVPSAANPLGVFSPENPDVRCADGKYKTDPAGFCRGT